MIKRVLGLWIGILTVLACSITAYATDNRIGNARENYCNVAFYMTDETAGGYPGSKFTAIWTDESGTYTGQYDFTKGNSWGNGRAIIVTVEAPVTFRVNFSGLEDGYKIVNTLDLSEDIIFETISGGTASVYWSVFDSDNITGTVDGISDDTIELTSGSEMLLQADNDSRIIEMEEAEELYQNFLSATAFIADDETWQNNVLVVYQLYAEAAINGYASWYENYVDGGTKEDFLAMSLYDRFVWVETYLTFAYYVNSGDFNKYFGNEDNFNTYATGNFINRIENISGYEPVEEAYLNLVQWQYDYVTENGVPFNFINHRPYLDEAGSLPESAAETESETIADDAEMEEIREELMAELSEEEIAELSGDTETSEEADGSSSGGMGVVIVLLVVVVVVGGGAFFFLRKKK